MKKTICIAGKNDIAVDVLLFCLNKYKHDEKIEIVAILTKKDQCINTWQRSLGWFCKKHHVKTVSLEDIYDIEELLFLSLEFDRIIKTQKFKSDRLFNLHFSLLPKYKGMYPSVLPVLNDEKVTGVTLHKIRDGIDTGEIIEQSEVQIEEDDSSLDVYKKLEKAGTELVTSYVDRLLDNQYRSRPQSNRYSTYYPSGIIDYGNLKLETKRTAYQIKKQVMAFAFRPYQLITFDGCGLIDAQLTEEVSTVRPGTILEQNEVYIKISTIDYNLILYKDVLGKLMDCIKNCENDRAMSLCASSKIINDRDKAGWSPLTTAVYYNNLCMFGFLIEKGADINVLSVEGTNLLMYAMECKNRYGDDTIFQSLLNMGLSPLETDYSGRDLGDYDKKSFTEGK